MRKLVLGLVAALAMVAVVTASTPSVSRAEWVCREGHWGWNNYGEWVFFCTEYEWIPCDPGKPCE